MKKTLSILLAVFILLSSSITAFASDVPTSDKVFAQMEGAVAFLTDGAKEYGVDQAVDFYTLVHSGVDMGTLGDTFIADVKSNLAANDGKIISSYGESLATYGAVILALIDLGENPADFYGYDITAAFTAMDPAAEQSSVYYYRVIIPATMYCTDDDFAKAVCDTFVDNNYTMGKGMANYGYYSCDNTAYFINALSSYAEEYPEVMKDAFTVLESYKTNGGYFSDELYVTDANADSTGLALMAYCSVLLSVTDEEADAYLKKVNSIYNELCNFEGSKPGVFVSSYTGEDDAYATKEALMGLEEYYLVALIQELDDPDETTTQINKAEPTTQAKPEITDKATTTKNNTSKKSPDTGAAATSLSFTIALAGASLLTLIKKK